MIAISISPSTISNLDVSLVESKLSDLLHAFAVLAPPERVIHVVTGSYNSETLCWRDWPLIEAIVIDAEVQGFEHVDACLNPKIKLFKHCAVPAETFGPVDNFVANNTLQSWLIVDCLSAVRILSGARDTLKETTLVCVCVLTEADFRGEPVGADINNIDSLLFGQGFKRLAFVTGLNPKIGNAIYGRPAEKLSLQELPFIKALNQELLAKVAEIAKLNEDLGNTKAHRYTLAAQLQASTESLQASEERSRQAAVQLQARAAELEANAAQITKLNEQLGHLSVERESLVVGSRSAQQNLQNAEQTIASFKSKLETEVSRSERLTAEIQELIHGQQLMIQELVKAKGQISLIKDLLLREQGL